MEVLGTLCFKYYLSPLSEPLTPATILLPGQKLMQSGGDAEKVGRRCRMPTHLSSILNSHSLNITDCLTALKATMRSEILYSCTHEGEIRGTKRDRHRKEHEDGEARPESNNMSVRREGQDTAKIGTERNSSKE